MTDTSGNSRQPRLPSASGVARNWPSLNRFAIRSLRLQPLAVELSGREWRLSRSDEWKATCLNKIPHSRHNRGDRMGFHQFGGLIDQLEPRRMNETTVRDYERKIIWMSPFSVPLPVTCSHASSEIASSWPQASFAKPRFASCPNARGTHQRKSSPPFLESREGDIRCLDYGGGDDGHRCQQVFSRYVRPQICAPDVRLFAYGCLSLPDNL